MSLHREMEAIMALPYMTGGQEVINCIGSLETKPVGDALSGIPKIIDMKLMSGSINPLSGASTQRSLVCSSFPLRKW
jgi:hypothetical protein